MGFYYKCTRHNRLQRQKGFGPRILGWVLGNDAEKRGASSVVASDSRINAYENLLFARSVLDSKVLPLFNVPVRILRTDLKQ